MAYGDSVIVKQPKAKQTIATCLVAPVVPVTLGLMKLDHVVNQHRLSGKQEGAIVIGKQDDGKLSICIAVGAEPASKWDYAAATSEITPA